MHNRGPAPLVQKVASALPFPTLRLLLIQGVQSIDGFRNDRLRPSRIMGRCCVLLEEQVVPYGFSCDTLWCKDRCNDWGVGEILCLYFDAAELRPDLCAPLRIPGYGRRPGNILRSCKGHFDSHLAVALQDFQARGGREDRYIRSTAGGRVLIG